MKIERRKATQKYPNPTLIFFFGIVHLNCFSTLRIQVRRAELAEIPAGFFDLHYLLTRIVRFSATASTNCCQFVKPEKIFGESSSCSVSLYDQVPLQGVPVRSYGCATEMQDDRVLTFRL
jgi:hypothetical protein